MMLYFSVGVDSLCSELILVVLERQTPSGKWHPHINTSHGVVQAWVTHKVIPPKCMYEDSD
jgi:hypothetical protein